MNTPRYLVAKFIPDLRRMEPRNVGVIVWSHRGVAAQFLGEKENKAGDLDGRSVPLYVTSLSAYKQWIGYWRSQLERGAVEPVRGGDPVPQTSPHFLEALAATSNGNFVLSEGGRLLDDIGADELSSLATHLFHLLVDPAEVEQIRDPALETLCDQLIDRTRLRHNPNFYKHGYKIECPIRKGGRSTVVTYEFNYAYKNGSLQRLYQRVPLSRQRLTLSKTVHDSAWMFERVIQQEFVTRNQSAALVRLTDEQRQDREVMTLLDELESVTRVLHLDEGEEVLREFQELATLPVHHR